MKKLRCLTAVFIIMSVFISTVPVCAESSQVSATIPVENTLDSEFENKRELLIMIGIIPKDNPPAENRPIKRSEFAFYASRLCGISYQSGLKSPFWDVADGSAYSEEIAYLAQIGAINGKPDGSFAPNEEITANEAVKILLSMTGYDIYAEAQGGYPGGYVKAAERSGLMSGGIKLDTPLRAGSLINLLYNALGVSVLDINSVTTGGTVEYAVTGKTLLNINFDIYVADGIMTENTVSNLRYGYRARGEHVVINGISYNSDGRYDKYLGYAVNCFYTEKNGVKSVVYLCNKEKNKTIRIAAEDIVSFRDNTLTYSRAGKSPKHETFNDVAIIFNGRPINFLSDYNNYLFDIDEGGVTLLSNDGDSQIDVVFIDSYTTLVVKSVDVEDKKIYDRYSSSKLVNLDDRNITYTIVNTLGETVGLEDLQEWDIVSVAKSKDGKNIDMIVSYERVEGVVSEYQTEDKYDIITVASKQYKVLKNNFKGDDALRLGSSYVFYLNALGNIAAADAQGTENFKIGFVVGVVRNGLSGSIIGLIDDKGVLKEYEMSDKIKIDGVKAETEQIEEIFAPKEGEDYTKMVVRYRLDEEGKVAVIDTPEYNPDKESHLSLVKRFDGNKKYKSGNRTFYGSYVMPNLTFEVCLPEVTDGSSDINIDDVLVFNVPNLGNDVEYPVELYSVGMDTRVLSAVVVKDGKYAQSIGSDTSLSIVDRFYYSRDEDDIFQYCISVYTNGEAKSYFIEDEKRALVTGVETGDIIRFATDAEGRVNSLELLYDYSEGEAIFNAQAYYDRYNAYPRFLWGRVYDVNEGYTLVLKSNDLDDVYKEDGITVNDDLIEIHNIPTAIAYSVESNGRVSVENITAEDFVTYISGGSDATELIQRTKYASFKECIVIKR